MIKSTQLSVVLLLTYSSVAMAGTIIEVQNKNKSTMIFIDENQARMDIGGGEFVIVDYQSQQIKIVNPQKQKIILLNGMPVVSNFPVLRTELKQRGTGSNVAGYQTQKFEYIANGTFCGVIHASKNVYQMNGIKELFNVAKMLMQRQLSILGGFAGMLDVCTLAEMKLSDHVTTIGIPMRTERNGYVETEIKSIKLNAEMPANVFAIPASYRVTTM